MFTRRELGALLGVALPGCAFDTEESPDMSFPLAPWHMWGTSQRLALTVNNTATGEGLFSGQLAKIAYGRPESFNFLFGFRVDALSINPVDYVIDVSFDLIVGIGRSVLQIPDFEHFRLANSGAVATTPPILFWSTQVRSPARDRTLSAVPPTAIDPGVTDYIVAEDLQCGLRVRTQGTLGVVQCEVFAFFSPRVHVRPEWFEGEFRGKETGGT
jgi:hypothetical protein